MKTKHSPYDVIIIGSGIGGLTCGNYLAKAGLKVAIFEQHDKVGGCCSSFQRHGFTFDTGAHTLSALGEQGAFRQILRELSIERKLRFVRPDPYDKVIFPEFSFTLGRDIKDTVVQLQKIFPKEAKNIERFFHFVETLNYMKAYPQLKDKRTIDFLNDYFKDPRLIMVFLTLAAYLGTFSTELSAFGTVVFYKDDVLDGGYYPLGGMQHLADIFAENFKHYSGKIYASSPVRRIIVKHKQAQGVEIEGGGVFRARYIISNADARLTFLNLIGKKELPKDYVASLLKMEPTVSAFCVFLGIKKKLRSWGILTNLRYIHDIKADLRSLKTHKHNLILSPSMCDPSLAPPRHDSLIILRLVPFKERSYWERNKFKIRDEYIQKAEELLPGLSDHIVVNEIATPYTYYRYTRNYQGAFGGWAPTISQFLFKRLTQTTPIENLYLAGHWTRPGLGINNVASSGAIVAKKLLKTLTKQGGGP